MGPFRFSMGETLAIAGGNERGTVIARAEYATGEPQYYLRYVAGDGCAVEAWWGESALAPAG